MKKRVKKLWIEALRSDQYKQGTGQLRDDENRFCCLGVLCNLHAQEHPRLAKQQPDPQYYFEEDSFLPEEVLKWAGLSSDNPVVVVDHADQTLASLNDSRVSFKAIAKVIEKQL